METERISSLPTDDFRARFEVAKREALWSSGDASWHNPSRQKNSSDTARSEPYHCFYAVICFSRLALVEINMIVVGGYNGGTYC
jgi:hypothetical protein